MARERDILVVVVKQGALIAHTLPHRSRSLHSLRFELAKIGSKVGTTIVCPSYIDNGMGKDADVKCRSVFPLMTEDYVVRRILAAVARNQGLVVLPGTIKAAYAARLYPTSVYDRVVRAWANV